jgi:hypothetical protein
MLKPHTCNVTVQNHHWYPSLKDQEVVGPMGSIDLQMAEVPIINIIYYNLHSMFYSGQ